MKKSLIYGLIATAVMTAGYATATLANYENGPNQSGLAIKIANTFNLDRSKVEEIITSYHNEQNTSIKNKMDELQPQLDAIRDLADVNARHEAMGQLQEDVQTWESENNVNLPLRGGMGGKGHSNMMGERQMRNS